MTLLPFPATESEAMFQTMLIARSASTAVNLQIIEMHDQGKPWRAILRTITKRTAPMTPNSSGKVLRYDKDSVLNVPDRRRA